MRARPVGPRWWRGAVRYVCPSTARRWRFPLPPTYVARSAPRSCCGSRTRSGSARMRSRSTARSTSSSLPMRSEPFASDSISPRRTLRGCFAWREHALTLGVGQERADGGDGHLASTDPRPARKYRLPPRPRRLTTGESADGVPNELSAPTMGHKDTRMLDRVYARLPPELLRVRLLAALGRCSAGAVNTSGEGAQKRTHQLVPSGVHALTGHTGGFVPGRSP